MTRKTKLQLELDCESEKLQALLTYAKLNGLDVTGQLTEVAREALDKLYTRQVPRDVQAFLDLKLEQLPEDRPARPRPAVRQRPRENEPVEASA